MEGTVVDVSDGRSDLMVDRKVVTPLFLFKQSTKTSCSIILDKNSLSGNLISVNSFQ